MMSEDLGQKEPAGATIRGTGVLEETFESLAGQVRTQTQAERRNSRSIVEVFEARVEANPEGVAVVCGQEQLSYEELNRRANRLAHYLSKAGAGPETLVGLCVERSLEMVVGVVGILKAGAAYVPLDTEYPADRLRYTLEDSGVALLVAQERQLAKLAPGAAHVICLEAEREGIERESALNPSRSVSPDNLAYVIYTSGSTGRPNGVAVTHRALVNLFDGLFAFLDLSPGDTWTVFHSYAFDLSVWEIWGALLSGGRLLIVPLRVAQATDDFERLLRAERVNVLSQTPFALRQLIHYMDRSQEAPHASALKQIICGGEAFPRELIGRLLELGAPVWNFYGPTEATVWVTLERVEARDADRPVALGEPIANVSMYLLDQELKRVPPDTPAEIYIGGVALARGYLRRPDLTAEKFIPDPFDQNGGARLYRTGDVGRYRSDGAIEYVERVDRQLKLRGYRIELGEIEAQLSRHTEVREAVVVIREDAPGERRLVAYFIAAPAATQTAELASDALSSEQLSSRQAVSVGADDGMPLKAYANDPLRGRPALEANRQLAPRLRSFLRERLPEYMVPSAFVELAEMPLTPNGKLDREALPAPTRDDGEKPDGYSARLTPAEEALADIWAAAFELPQVGRQDNFLELGGHSLLATQIISRIRTIFEVELPLRALFEAPTVAALAAAIARSQRERRAPRSLKIERAERRRALPLSLAQQRLWLLDQLASGASSGGFPFALRLRGKLELPLLQRALNEIISRHEILRTVFSDHDGVPTQTACPAQPLDLPYIDLTGLPEEEREPTAKALLLDELGRPFDLARGPVLRARLLRLEHDRYILAFTSHFIVADGYSAPLVARELAALYRAFHAGRPSPLEALPVQYADYALWQQQYLAGGELERQLAYWKRRLTPLPVPLDLPFARPRPDVRGFGGARRNVRLPDELTERLRALSRAAGVTLYTLLLAGFKALLYRYTGQRDISVGTPVANRNHAEVERLIGFFLNTVVMRSLVREDGTFEELLRQVNEEVLESHEHQDVPLPRVVEELGLAGGTEESMLFRVMFALVPLPELTGIELPQLRMSLYEGDFGVTTFDLVLSLAETGEGVIGYFEYSTDLFTGETIERIERHYLKLLEEVIADPAVRLLDLRLESEEERVAEARETEKFAEVEEFEF